MDALAGKRVEIDGKRGDKRLAFAGLHFGNLAVMQHHAANQLHIEWPEAQSALGGLAHRGESRNHKIVERLSGSKFRLECLGQPLEIGIAQFFIFGLQRIDGGHPFAICCNLAAIIGAENFLDDVAESEHLKNPVWPCKSPRQ